MGSGVVVTDTKSLTLRLAATEEGQLDGVFLPEELVHLGFEDQSSNGWVTLEGITEHQQTGESTITNYNALTLPV